MQLICHLSSTVSWRLGTTHRDDRGDWVAQPVLVGFEKYCCTYGSLIAITVRTTANKWSRLWCMDLGTIGCYSEGL